MHGPSADDAPFDPAEVRRLARLRFARREAMLHALLDALFGETELDALDRGQSRRLLALLQSRADDELERIARRGHAGRSTLALRLEILFDGVPDADEQRAMTRRLLELLRHAAWPAASLALRSVVVTELPGGDRPEVPPAP